MSRWKLFGKSKEEEISPPEDTIGEEKTEEEFETTQKLEDQPLVEYNETLYSTGYTPKKAISSKKGKTASSDQRIWRDVDDIEDKIDTLHISRAKKPVTEIDRKVDKIVSKVKIIKEEKTGKPSNVIYVVSKPQPGEVRGDWAVRSHSKIFSHHKTKKKAIEKARKIAKERSATVMVQNTDGTFSDGFKPK